MEIDPLGEYAFLSPGKVFECMGLIPYFVAELAMTADVETLEEARGILESCYGFPFDWNSFDTEGVQLSEEGVYSYPDDPDLKPYAKFEVEHGVIYVYPYAMVALVYPDGRFMGRMD